ncbi:hypothetical protein BST25_18300 [Mycobacterium heidelbergense]|uniref:Core-binding (CB) domain-containing protein n=1 Tax=Mycobacterium heidelbergense TaxID=53376 RepID=A0A1X0DFY2_MYCHE|nr:hypothetical protein BST25_18300 [Mycobacterium heidelbergense]
MQADRKAHHTIDSYLRGARYYLTWRAAKPDAHPFTRAARQRWIAHLLDSGAQPATARIRHQAVRRFAAWLADKQRIDHDPFLDPTPPQIDTEIVERLTNKRTVVDAQSLRRQPPPQPPRTKPGYDHWWNWNAHKGAPRAIPTRPQPTGAIIIRKAKGGQGRHVPFPTQTGAVIDRYPCLRHHHRLRHPLLLLGRCRRLPHAGRRLVHPTNGRPPQQRHPRRTRPHRNPTPKTRRPR